MYYYWKIRCFHRTKKEFFDRHLILETETLESHERARVEYRLHDPTRQGRAALEFRTLFTEVPDLDYVSPSLAGGMHTFCIPDYFEDETGKEISIQDMGMIVDGRPWFPGHYRRHDIEWAMSSEPSAKAEDFDGIVLTQEETDCLAYYVRDVQELRDSEFLKNPPSLVGTPGTVEVETISVDLIKGFATVFRRLYMKREPGCFVNACDVFCSRYPNPRSVRWIRGEREEYERRMDAPVSAELPWRSPLTFTSKQLIEAMIYTQFAHQPQERRIRQHSEYLQEVGDRNSLDWLFYSVMHRMSLHYISANSVISVGFRAFQDHCGCVPSFNVGPLVNSGGRGRRRTQREVEEERLQEHAHKLGERLWQDAGSPAGELPTYIQQARERLKGQ